MFRFEKGEKVIGYVYNDSGTNSQKWIDEKVYLLNGAVMQQAASFILALGLIAAASF